MYQSPFAVQKCVLVFSPDSIPPYFVTVFKSVVPSTRLFKSGLSRHCTLVVDSGDLITKIYQSPIRCVGMKQLYGTGTMFVGCI